MATDPIAERGWDVSHVHIDDGRKVIVVKAGHRGTERIVPPAGEDYAFDRDLWAREVQVSISPRRQSVRVWVDGKEVVPDGD